MLFGWGIHHLHLSTRSKGGSSRFVRRSDELLLAMFGQEHVSLGSPTTGPRSTGSTYWRKPSGLGQERGLCHGWLGLSVYLNNCRPRSTRSCVTTASRRPSRWTGLSTSPHGGVTTAGTPTGATMAANRLMRPIDEVEGRSKLPYLAQTDTTQVWVEDATHLSVRGGAPRSASCRHPGRSVDPVSASRLPEWPAATNGVLSDGKSCKRRPAAADAWP